MRAESFLSWFRMSSHEFRSPDGATFSRCSWQLGGSFGIFALVLWVTLSMPRTSLVALHIFRAKTLSGLLRHSWKATTIKIWWNRYATRWPKASHLSLEIA